MPTQNKPSSLKDNFYALRHFISGQGLSLAVFKATRADTLGPKTKHVDYLTTVTHEPNVSIPKLIKYLSIRAHQAEWSVVFKALIVIHHILNRGNQRFIQNLASSTGNDQLFAQINSFNDDSSKLALDMSTYLRRYARYLDSRIRAYRILGVDFCRLQSDSARLPSKLKDMSYDELMLTIPSLQNQFDLVLKFDITMGELNNGIIDQAFLLLYGDLVKLYIGYQAAIIRVVELFLATKYLNQARELYDVYCLFLIRMDMVQDFMLVVESTGIKKDDFPKVSRVPNINLDALKERLRQLERKPNSMLQINVPAINNGNNLLNPSRHFNNTHNNSNQHQKSRTSNSKISLSATGCRQAVSGKSLSPSSSNKIKICNNLFKSTDVLQKTARRRNRLSIDDSREGFARVGQQLSNGTQNGNYVDFFSDNFGHEHTPSKDTPSEIEPIKLSLHGHDMFKTPFDLPTKTANDTETADVKLLEPPLDRSKEKDDQEAEFDLMVIDSHSSSVSRENSVMEDANPYVQLDEKDLLEQVFPPVPELSSTLLQTRDAFDDVSNNMSNTHKEGEVFVPESGEIDDKHNAPTFTTRLYRVPHESP